MSDQGAHLSTDRSPTPNDADFFLKIDFLKHPSNPQRVFQAADAMIRAFQRLDTILCASIDSRIEPAMILEEVEAGSIKVWLRNTLTAVEDDSIKRSDWRQVIREYLIEMKYTYISWSNKDSPSLTLADLSNEIRRKASETNVKHFPDYAPLSVVDLAEATKQIQKAKSFLVQGDAISFAARESPPVSFDLEVIWTNAELFDLSIEETITLPEMPMNLIVRRPDYCETSKWHFRHGKKPIQATITDTDWLIRFQQRQIDIRPGDALACIVSIQNGYGFDKELLSEVYTVIKVIAF